ncbi:MAG: phage integrase SAM-like domain-containing protein [Flavisolibacter sp.]
MLLKVFTQHNKEMVTLIQTAEYAPRTLTDFETTFKHVQNFRGWKYNLKDMAIEKIDFSFVIDFEFYLIYVGLPR